jgi:glycosyltransferase involved in cell wall biosynthesis
MPRLDKKGIPYQILVAGKGLPEDIQQRIESTPNVIYTGFLPDIDNFINACDVMLNPVLQGGGIKTKAVEALGYNKNVVSCFSGAAGLIREACGSNLLVSADNDWDTYAEDVVRAINMKPDIPQLFYQTYYWGNIAQKMLGIMQAIN